MYRFSLHRSLNKPNKIASKIWELPLFVGAHTYREKNHQSYILFYLQYKMKNCSFIHWIYFRRYFSLCFCVHTFECDAFTAWKTIEASDQAIPFMNMRIKLEHDCFWTGDCIHAPKFFGTFQTFPIIPDFLLLLFFLSISILIDSIRKIHAFPNKCESS